MLRHLIRSSRTTWKSILEHLTSRHDRCSAPLVSKSWHKVEAYTRTDLFIGNCYAVSPCRVTNRYRRMTTGTIKGRPRFADYSLMPRRLGAMFGPWVKEFEQCYRGLEKIHPRE